MYCNQRKILYVITSLDVGGAENHLTQVMVGLKARGWQPELFVIKPGGPFTSFLRANNISIYGQLLPAWLNRLFMVKKIQTFVHLAISLVALIWTIIKCRPRIIHFFLPASYIIGGIAALITRVPFRIMSRRSLNLYQEDHKLLVNFEQRLHPRMTMICGNSQAVMRDLEAEGVDSNKLRLIYNGVDMSQYNQPFSRDAARVAAGFPPGTLVMIMVANIIPYKGHADLIKALSLIKNQLPQPWQLLCLGRDDGTLSMLQDQAKMCGVNGHITWLGSVQDVADFLRMADIGILCSHQEGFSNAVLEGAAAGLPMVVTDVGGNAEVVIDGETGYVVPLKNVSKLAGAILKVADDENRTAMGQRGKQYVTDRFSMSSCLDGYESLYNGCNEQH